MEITEQLVKPFIEKMEADWQELRRELSQSPSSEAKVMRPSVEQKLRQLEKLKMMAAYQEQSKQDQEFTDLRELLRYLKLDLRFSQRRWKRHLVSKIRTQKRQERRNGDKKVA